MNTSTLAKWHWMMKLRKMRWIGRREVSTAGAFKGRGKAAGRCSRSPQMEIKETQTQAQICRHDDVKRST